MGRVREEGTYADSIPGTGLGSTDTAIVKFKWGNIQMSLEILFQRTVLYRPKEKW